MKELFKVKFEVTVEATKELGSFAEAAGVLILDGIKKFFIEDDVIVDNKKEE